MTLGTGYDNLAYRLYTRIENLRRKLTTSPQIMADSPPFKKRKMVIDSYGCVAWSIPLPEGVTNDELISKKEVLQKCLDSDIDRTITLLKETYYLQRAAINQGAASIGELLKDWPILFTERGIAAHFEILTNINLFEMLESTVMLKSKTLFSFFRSSGQKEVKVFMSETDLMNNPNQLLLLVLVLGKSFNESTDSVFFTDEVFNPHNLQHLPKHPCLVGKGTSILRCDEFFLVMDGIAVNTGIKDATVAVAAWFASFYVFNYLYPLEYSCTLEFFQRCFVGINPISGSKVERKKGKKLYKGIHPKILNLLKKLKIFDSWVTDCRS
nr:uncharacterized protein LOC107450152 [Parasteatoda tepidariorum]